MTIRSLDDVQSPLPDSNPGMHNPYKGVRGWLLLLCIALVFLNPLNLMAEVGKLAQLGDVPILVRLYVFAFSAFSIYAGIGLWRIAPGAVKRAKLFFWTNLICTLGLTALAAINLGFKFEHVTSASGALISFGIWHSYLSNSKRVQATYGLEAPKVVANETMTT